MSWLTIPLTGRCASLGAAGKAEKIPQTGKSVSVVEETRDGKLKSMKGKRKTSVVASSSARLS